MNREIQDPNSIHKLIDSLYRITPVFMEVDGEDVQIKIIDSSPNSIKIRSPKSNSNTRERVITMRSKDNIFVSTFMEIGTDDLGNSILQPLKILIKDILSGQDTNVFRVSNVINHNDIFKSLGDDRINQIIKNSPKVDFMFDFFEVYVNERMNSRMRLMNSFDKSIFIPNIEQPELVKSEFVPYNDYHTLTKTSDFLDKYKSEICIPIKYKNFAMIGYVHAMHSTRLDSNSFNTFKLVAASIIKAIHTSGIFEESKEICQVLEVNATSIRFLHPPTRLSTRIFSMGGTIIFDIIGKSGRRKFLRGIVKGIKPTQKDYLITCDFVGTPEDTEAMKEFLKRD